MAHVRFRFALLASLVLGGGCVGSIGDGPGDGAKDGPGVVSDPGLDVALSAIRRMTPAQYVNTVRDLLGDPGLELDLDDDTGEAFTLLGAQKLNAAADFVASRKDAWTPDPFPCDTSGEGSAQCVDDFIATFGRRAFRRPVDPDETAWLRGVFDEARVKQSFEDSLLIVLQVMLQSPQMIYFLELGAEPKGLPAGIRPLTGWERATRLSYFLWDTTPDDELLAAAESGALDTKEGMSKQAARLVEDPRVRATMRDFYLGWLELDGTATHPSLEEATKNAELFPEDSPALRAAMRAELEALVERVIFEQGGTLQTLLTTTDAWVNAPLAALYGVPGPADDATFEWVKLPADKRAGMFTRAGFLGLYSGGSVKSPIRRGAFLVKEALCVELGKPPPNANDTPVEGGTVEENGMKVHKTVREDVAAKTAEGACAGCHALINPMGFAFEHFDALGKWQDEESGDDEDGPYTLEIDDSGAIPEFDASGQIMGQIEVVGPVEMSKALSESPGLSACMSTRWFERALSRSPEDEDARTLDALEQALAGGATLADVVTTLVGSDAFLFMRPRED